MLSSGTGLKIYMITEKEKTKSTFKDKRACGNFYLTHYIQLLVVFMI